MRVPRFCEIRSEAGWVPGFAKLRRGKSGFVELHRGKSVFAELRRDKPGFRKESGESTAVLEMAFRKWTSEMTLEVWFEDRCLCAVTKGDGNLDLGKQVRTCKTTNYRHVWFS